MEVFDGGIEGLLRYHRARRMLVSCLLLPPLAGAICAAEKEALVLFLFTLLFFSNTGLNQSTDFVIYGTGNSCQNKSGVARMLLLEHIRHNLICLAFVLLVTSTALAWQRKADMAATDIRLREALQLFYVFFFCSTIVLRFSLSDIPIKRPRLLFYILFFSYYWIAGVLAVFSFDPAEALSPSIPEGYSPPALSSAFLIKRLAYLIPPLFVVLMFLTRWLAATPCRDRLFYGAYCSCDMAWVLIFISYFFTCRMPLTFFFYIDDAWILREPTILMWLGAFFLLASSIAVSWARAFLQCYKIRRGLYFDIPTMLDGKNAPKSFREHAAFFSDKVIRARITQAAKPLLGSARRWRHVRLVTSLGERSWLAGLLSSLVTACYLLVLG